MLRIIICLVVLLLTACKVSSPEGGSVLMRPNFSAMKSYGTIDGHEIGFNSLDNATRRRLHQMEVQLYEARKTAMDQAFQDYVLLKEADRRGINVADLLKHDVYEPSQVQANQEALAFLDEHREDLTKLSQEEWAKVPGMEGKDMSTAASREAVERIVAASIKKRRQEEALKSYVDNLRHQMDVRVFLQPPPVLRQKVDLALGPRRGAEKPSVEVVEFGSYGDRVTFQMEEELRNAAVVYTKQLAWSFRHLPKSETPEVRTAHWYAYCAQQQDKFWALHDLFIKEWYKLTPPFMKDLAKKAGLEDVPLATCMDSMRGLQNTLDFDQLTARDLNVRETPVFFVNGMMVTGLDGPERLRETIEHEAKAAYFIAAEKSR